MSSVLDIIERVTSALQLQASQKNIHLNVELPKDMPHAVEADQALLHQAVYNLVENAIKYTPEDGRVTIRTRLTTWLFDLCHRGFWHRHSRRKICRICSKNSIAANNAKRAPSLARAWGLPLSIPLPTNPWRTRVGGKRGWARAVPSICKFRLSNQREIA